MDYLGKVEQGVSNQFGDQYGQQFGQIAQNFGSQFGGGQPAGLTQWGSSSAYTLKNLSTGMYLAAHTDGQLVAEDDTTGHHDIPWNIYSTGDGKYSACPSCSSHIQHIDHALERRVLPESRVGFCLFSANVCKLFLLPPFECYLGKLCFSFCQHG